MVAPQHHRAVETAVPDCVVERQRDAGAAFAVGIENAGLGAHHQIVASGLAYPAYVVAHLRGDVFGSAGRKLVKHADGYGVRGCQVFRPLAHTHPAEGSEAVVEVHWAHYVLHVARITETAVRPEHVGAGAAALQQEGVAVVEEVHPPVAQAVNCSHVPAERGLDGFFEALRFLRHQAFALLQAVAHGVVAACPGVVERGLVRAEIDPYSFIGEALPEVNNVAHVGEGDGVRGGDGLSYAGNEFVELGVKFVHPTLLVALFGRLRVDFGGHGDYACDVACLGLRARHSAEAGGDEKKTAASGIFSLQATIPLHLTGGVHHRNGGAVNDALRTYVHIGDRRHLPVLRYAEGVEALPVVGLGVVGNHHSVRHNHTGSILVAGEEPQRVAGVHHQRLLVGHSRKILHREPVLRPILENGAVAAVDYEFVRMLGHARVQVILNHRHNCRRLPGFRGVLIDRAGVHWVRRAQAVHIDAAVFFQLLRKFGRKRCVVPGFEVAQRVFQRKSLLLAGQYVLALWGVIYALVVFGMGGQFFRNACQNLPGKFVA